MADINRAFYELESDRNIIIPLLEEYNVLANELKSAESPVTRRFFVRSIFALIEATLWAHKQALFRMKENDNVFDKGEITFLSETDYQLKPNGKVKEVKTRIPLRSDVKFFFNMLSKALGNAYVVDLGDGQWDNFETAITIRDRITHPKSAEDSIVTEDDLSIVLLALDWFTNEVNNHSKAFKKNVFLQAWKEHQANKKSTLPE